MKRNGKNGQNREKGTEMKKGKEKGKCLDLDLIPVTFCRKYAVFHFLLLSFPVKQMLAEMSPPIPQPSSMESAFCELVLFLLRPLQATHLLWMMPICGLHMRAGEVSVRDVTLEPGGL